MDGFPGPHQTPTAGHLRVTGLRKRFGDRMVLSDLSFTLAPGEILALLGPSGSGKTTLLSLLTGALQPDAGEMSCDDTPLSATYRPFAYMPQQDGLLPWRRVLANAALGLEVAGVRPATARARVRELLADFGLAGTDRLFPSQLSGGMRQRVAFLRTVVQERPVLLLDEPFSALDAMTRDELQRWLITMWERHRWGIVFVTHDIREAVRLADRVLVLPRSPGGPLREVAVSRDIDRLDGFVVDPRVGPLEWRVQQALRGD